MNWTKLLQTDNEYIILPWLGGKVLRSLDRTWRLQVPPQEFGWYKFELLSGRKIALKESVEANPDILKFSVKGYLIGDRLVEDGATANINNIYECSSPVFLLEAGLDRFQRIKAGRIYEDGPLIFQNVEMPLGPEEDVLKAFLDRKLSIGDIPNIYPALDLAFRLETEQRANAERRRLELEQRRREEEERRAKEERRQSLVKQLGDAVSRREMAKIDFEAAARAALGVGGAEYLDHRNSTNRNEMIVRFRLRNRRFECVCDKKSLQIIDSGICLRGYDEYNNTEVVDDDKLSLESISSVILEAINNGVLHVFRHV